MKIQEAIKDIRENVKPVVGGKSLDIAIESMEKQIPKKPIKDDTSYSGYKCPACNSNIYQLRSHNICKTPHCIFCGQKLDWEEGGTSD